MIMNRKFVPLALGSLLALLLTGCSTGSDFVQDGIDAGEYGRAATKKEMPELVTKDGKQTLVFPDKFGMKIELSKDGRARLIAGGTNDTTTVADANGNVSTSTCGGGCSFSFPAGDSIRLLAFKRSGSPELSVYWTDLKTS